MRRSASTLHGILIGLALTGAAVAQDTATIRKAIPNPKPIADSKIVSWTEKAVQDRQPSADQRRIDEIGWASTLVQAKELALKYQRPIFLFTHDGQISTGRC